jgi:DNA-directed RNA polymerase specialized sigma24 family protein
LLGSPALLLLDKVWAWTVPDPRLPPTLAAVLRVLAGQPVARAAKRLGVPPQQLSQWVSRFVEAGEAELMRTEPTRD